MSERIPRSPRKSSKPQRPEWPGRRATWTAMIAGFGLMGASLALRLRAHWPRLRLVAIDRPATGRRLVAQGLADAHGTLLALPKLIAAEQPRLLVLALPVDTIVEVLPRVAQAVQSLPAHQQPLILDLGSVKGAIVEAAAACACPRFIGGHPMAGSERRGHAHAVPEMFESRPFVLCREANDSRRDQREAAALVQSLGAKPLWLGADEHDRAVAITSHLPHLCAFSLLELAREIGAKGELDASLLAQLAAGSWRDATRVGAADPHQWASIFHYNRAPLLDALDTWLRILQMARENLQSAEDASAFELGLSPRPRRRGRRSKGSGSSA